jgi:hypothetical protein
VNVTTEFIVHIFKSFTGANNHTETWYQDKIYFDQSFLEHI